MKKKLYLSDDDKKILGVCGGLAEYFEVDANIIRILFILLFFSAGTGLLAYIIMWFVMPKKTSNS